MWQYNYVIFGSSWDLYLQAYSDIIGLEGVEYISDRVVSSNWIRRFHIGRVNKIINLPFKSIWNSFFFKNKFKDDKPICFIFTSVWPKIAEQTHLIDYLRHCYNKSKCVLFLQDLYRFVKVDYTKYDLALSFDHGDSNKYGFTYHPLVFSAYNASIVNLPKSDIYFLGKAKNRLTELIKVYEILKQEGLIIDFNIVGVNKEDQLYADEINYIKMIPYEDNLKHIMKCKCVLEIMQQDGLGYTQRTVECVGMNKKLLTNNRMIDKAPFYSPNYISQFSSYENIDKSFLYRLKTEEDVNYNYKDNLSPIELLSFIESRL